MLFRIAVFSAILTPLLAQQNFENVQIETIEVKPGIYMLVGSGGNIGLSVGKDAAFVIDDQYAPLTAKIQEAISKVSDQPIKFVLNTHWHGDHTGGNENLGKAGALIVAHNNVRQRMSSEQFMESFDRRVAASPDAALPVVTFNDSVSFHINGQEINAFHVDPAHTDGDSVIHFRNSNVFHMGDLFFNGRYPFIDLSSGGSFLGMIRAVERVLNLTNDETRIIPGHGDLANRSDLISYHKMLLTVRSRIEPLVRESKSIEEVLELKPTEDLDGTWGQGFMNAENFLRIVFQSLKSEG